MYESLLFVGPCKDHIQSGNVAMHHAARHRFLSPHPRAMLMMIIDPDNMHTAHSSPIPQAEQWKIPTRFGVPSPRYST